MSTPATPTDSRHAEWAMGIAALALACNAWLVTDTVFNSLGRSLRPAGAPMHATGAETAARRNVRSAHQEPWDEDRTMGRYPDQNPHHVPGET
jgi:hypothetical protein